MSNNTTPNSYLVTPAPTIENPSDTRNSVGLIPSKEGRISCFVYSIKFLGDNYSGEFESCTALVVAQDAYEAFRLFRTALFMEHNSLYEELFKCEEPLTVKAVSVFCAADLSQLYKVTIL